jgi:hypothetical protein
MLYYVGRIEENVIMMAFILFFAFLISVPLTLVISYVFNLQYDDGIVLFWILFSVSEILVIFQFGVSLKGVSERRGND